VHLDVTDPYDRAIVEAARAWAVPPSIFLGRVHLDGVPDWLEDDQRAALDLLAYEAQLCPGCKQPMAETTDPANEFRYVAEPPIRCHRCTTTSVASDAMQSNPHPSALFVPIRLKAEQPDR
jgi:hypothetical protein